uniref:tRNA (uracil-O(2)-)-methyltransferase n=1 Tax=Pseudonaja textilis TaxID=8673 RepID=A0A670Y7N6_PSETE
MEAVGEGALRDPAGRLPDGFWAAAAVWLERPQVANKRLSGACAERGGPGAGPAGAGGAGAAPPAAPPPAAAAAPRPGAGGARWASPARPRPPSPFPLPLSPFPLPGMAAVWATPSAEGRPPARPGLWCPRRAGGREGAGPSPGGVGFVAGRTCVLPRMGLNPLPLFADVLNGRMTFLPLEETCQGQYKVKVGNIYQIRLRHMQDDEWTVSVLLNPEKYVPDGIVYPKAEWLGNQLISKLVKWSTEITKNEFKRTLSLISVARYSQVYQELKEKYKEMVKVWPEVTDPEKFVYEDVAIATYLLVLWEDERARRGLSEKQSFLDLGCGNGLLVHILGNEGHPGKGIDVRRRKIWDMYGPQTCLEERAINPDHLYPEADWLIGNHSDELTPWIPVIAARSSSSCRYFLLPCCFFDFYGKYNRRQSQKSQYREYLDFVAEVGTVCGFQVEEDCLRIPSTKRVTPALGGPSCPSAADERREFIRKRRPGGPVTLAPGGSRPRPRQEQSLSAAGQRRCAEEREGRPSRPPGFLPRGKEQVRNCTTLPHALVDQVALKVAHLLLSETDGSLLHGPSSPWNRGGESRLPLSDIAGHLDKATLKTLKKEHGGLQTLLRNNHQVFQVQHGKVRLRDWREGERPRKQLRARPARARLPSEATKTRLCWFDRHHPQGCPLPSASCPYAHGSAELNQRRIMPPGSF